MDTHYIDKLREGAFKVTPQRKAIIRYLLDRNKDCTPEEVWNYLRSKFVQCGLPSVYRNLESLVTCGILVKIHRFDNKRHYGICHAHTYSHHHHIICTSCGKIGELSECGASKYQDKVIDGFKITNHFLQLEGLCEGCR